ncbi:hypothetical protein F5Y08DRAFT_343531 [Xylaria arbuscula]|nr:hypothetical protein F5Y08DRAFT_343531 [Xylaria arbuscula]
MGLLSIEFRRDEDANRPPIQSTPKSSEITGEDTTFVDPWMIVVIVAGALIVVTLAVIMGMHYIKSRRARKTGFQPVEEKETSTAPYPHPPKRRSDRQKREDLERDMMIRKSLASRSSLVSNSDAIPAGSQEHLEQQQQHPIARDRDSHHTYYLPSPLGEDGGEMTSLREDWKAWEARVQSERRSSNPYDQHPAFASYLSVPQPTRMASPVRGGPAVYRHM